ncbi:tripartite tricarboxylate transporter substrate-binding protein [Acuticoccus sediminis]|uniref:Tripartite tricarboxylate transporter substrate-binding protein n=1 Tax=Acuticoccus sediminis TaxID=2184697 RepID=A0A8B2NS94_9HYPH|nr:tripartite tricarboxylate transporter substrate-binding protein [Acuticoccus sediminis]
MMLAGAASAPAYAEYPDRPIQLVVPWGAGGGTDAVGRIFATLLEKELGQPVNVVNRTGGSGVVGHTAISSARPDGYTLGVMTVEITMMHHQGLTPLTYKDYDVLALVNADPGGVMVAADSGYGSLEDLLTAIKNEPAGTLKASGTGQGGIWHVGLAGWLMSEGVDPNKVTWVPSQGAAPGLTDMVAGGVDIVTASLPEGRALIEAGKVKPLATMGAERQPIFPDTPTLAEADGSDWTVAAWRALVAPKGLPEDVAAKLESAIETAYKSDEFQSFMKDRGFGLMWLSGDEATDFMGKSDEDFGKVMKEAGLVQ